MRWTRRYGVPTTVLLMTLATATATGVNAGSQERAKVGGAVEYAVLIENATSLAVASAALQDLGAEILQTNEAVGLVVVRSTAADFVERAGEDPVVAGVARNRPIGEAPIPASRHRDATVITEADLAAAAVPGDLLAPAAAAAEPFAGRQWDMATIHASTAGSYGVQLGQRGVRVGIIDTGIDGSHPDIAPNFDKALSRNFTTDIPLIDGPCEEEPDKSCNDAPDVDEDGHGTHVAGTVGAALNGLGMAGVAPGVTLVNLRAGQDSGYFFLQPVVDALTYAGDNGIDVVNLSFYVDPWLFNCRANPADSRAEQLEQRTVVKAVQRAVDYAWRRGTTVVGALGNENTDLSKPELDNTSPDFPPGTNRKRTIDNSCVNVPAELRHVVSVSSIGPSGKKSDFSNYGLEQNDLAAPGGFAGDFAGTPRARQPENLILAPYPEAVGRAAGTIGVDGAPLSRLVLRDCRETVCAYYQYLQGTSMAAPHVAGVAALIVSQFGQPDKVAPGLTLRPSKVERKLFATATATPCPAPVVTYELEGRPPSYNAVCTGDATFNSIYGHGIVDALAAVSGAKP